MRERERDREKKKGRDIQREGEHFHPLFHFPNGLDVQDSDKRIQEQGASFGSLLQIGAPSATFSGELAVSQIRSGVAEIGTGEIIMPQCCPQLRFLLQ